MDSFEEEVWKDGEHALGVTNVVKKKRLLLSVAEVEVDRVDKVEVVDMGCLGVGSALGEGSQCEQWSDSYIYRM